MNYGFVHEIVDIKVLVLFIMRRLPEPVTMEVLLELIMFDDGISYFDVTDGIYGLVKTGHLLFAHDKYSITDKGLRNGELVEKNLPFTVRMKIEEATAGLRSVLNRDSMIKTHNEAIETGGCRVFLALSDGIGEIFSMQLFAANEQQAKALESGFRKKAEKIYHTVIEMMLGDNEKSSLDE